MSNQLPTMDDLRDIYKKAYRDAVGTDDANGRAGITAVIDRLDAWRLVAPQSRPIPEGWSNETPPKGENVRVSVGNGTYLYCHFTAEQWANRLSLNPAAIWHPLPVDPRVEP